MSPTGRFDDYLRLPSDHQPQTLEQEIGWLADAWGAYHGALGPTRRAAAQRDRVKGADGADGLAPDTWDAEARDGRAETLKRPYYRTNSAWIGLLPWTYCLRRATPRDRSDQASGAQALGVGAWRAITGECPTPIGPA